jgi:hypothetical protein
MSTTEMTDGFHLVIDALKLNEIDTIYGVAGIPITDLLRLAQAEGIRYFGFRHEQSAGNAAAIAGYLTRKPGVCFTVSASEFLNGLIALANATTNCFPMILISGSSDHAIIDLEQGDYEELDQLTAASPMPPRWHRERTHSESQPEERARRAGRKRGPAAENPACINARHPYPAISDTKPMIAQRAMPNRKSRKVACWRLPPSNARRIRSLCSQDANSSSVVIDEEKAASLLCATAKSASIGRGSGWHQPNETTI